MNIRDCCHFFTIKRQALHAKRLGLVHPITKETLQFEIPLPEDMQNLLEKLKS